METRLREIVEGILVVASALFPIVNPLGSAPMFLAMTEDATPEQRRALASAVTINSFVLMLASMLAGVYVLDFFGLSIPVVQVAGGIVVFAIGWNLLNQHPSADHAAAVTASGAPDVASRAFYPLTMPITVGPGSISVAITLGANHKQYTHSAAVNWMVPLIGVTLVAASVYISYRYAERVMAWLGRSGTTVALRLTAFIVLCLGVQITWNGLQALLTTLPQVHF